jgi:hypothetical protein
MLDHEEEQVLRFIEDLAPNAQADLVEPIILKKWWRNTR